jgi:hypothetical protein
LFNSYELGGIVILLRPDVPVSPDSRNAVYGRRDVIDAERIAPAWTSTGRCANAVSTVYSSGPRRRWAATADGTRLAGGDRAPDGSAHVRNTN